METLRLISNILGIAAMPFIIHFLFSYFRYRKIRIKLVKEIHSHIDKAMKYSEEATKSRIKKDFKVVAIFMDIRYEHILEINKKLNKLRKGM